MRKSVGGANRYYVYNGDDILAEYSTGWTAASAAYTQGPATDDPFLRMAGSSRQFYHQDGLGSVIATSDATTATVAGTQRFDAWGNVAASTGTTPSQYGYTGREPDATGLMYYRARYYSADTGRFTQRDPIGLAGGINEYSYVGGNPVNATDPSGLAGKMCNIGVYGTPQVTGGWGHAQASMTIGDAGIANGKVKNVYYNQSLAKITGNPAAGGLRPDVVLEYSQGVYQLYEVPSPSQTPGQMTAKGAKMVQNLSNIGIKSTAQTVTVSDAMIGKFSVRALGVLSVAPMLLRAVDVYQFEQREKVKVPVIYQLYYEAGLSDTILPPWMMPM